MPTLTMILDPHIDPRERQRRHIVTNFASALDIPVSDVTVLFHDRYEMIYVETRFPVDYGFAMPTYRIVVWTMQISSDDDCYEFSGHHGRITFPLEA